MHPRQATQTLAGRLGVTVLVLGVVYGVLGALNACQAPIPFTPEQRRDWSPEQGATSYPVVGGEKDAGGE